MKRNFTLLLLILFIGSTVKAQRLLTEDFNYAAGDLVTVSDTVWEHLAGNTKPIQVMDGNLTYPGYATNPADTSRKIRLDSTTSNSEIVLTRFAKQDTGTVYASFLLSVLGNTNLTAHGNASGEYFASFLPASDNTKPLSGLTIRRGSASGTFNLGIFSRIDSATSIVWGVRDYAVGDTLLVAIGYQVVAGDSNNVVKLWVNPPTNTSQPTPEAQGIDIDNGSDSLKISKLALYQNGSHTPVCDIDAIKISTTWDDAVLPLQLLSFNVVNNNGYASLTWQTCGEINVKDFEVQRSGDARSFTTVANIAAKNGACGTNYAFSDAKELGGTAYYRLKIVDNDGRESYSATVRVDGKLPAKVSIFPNPVLDNVACSHPKAVEGAYIKIVSLGGSVVATIPVAKDAVQTSFNVSKLAKGNYLLVFRNGGQQQTLMILKQ